MGYCNKRKRAKRKRTRSLNAMKNLTDKQHYSLSSDDSSLERLEQNSNHQSFFSTYSHLSNTGCDGHMIPPQSIFLDDTNTSTIRPNDVNDFNLEVGSNEGEQSFLVNNEYLDELSNISEVAFDMMSLNHNDDDTIQSTGSSSFDNITASPCSGSAHYKQHHFDHVTSNETASYKIMCLLDSSGAPRICYDRLIALLKKLTKIEGFDVQKALNRETLMRRLGGKCKSIPRLQNSFVNKQEVFRFQFHDMLQDLVNSTSEHLHEI